jgi:small conductance mechanosensitive channel
MIFTNLFQESWGPIVKNWLLVALDVLPDLLLVILLYFITRRLINTIINRIQSGKSEKYEREGDLESKKRMLTITELLRTTQLIALSVIVWLVILSQLGLDIGPILAGAGIVGLAVGFGSQELVRDVITGFFMLIEDQIRVGDVVSINGTTAAVEKIELRTITLRDSGGVVHIFQNGKINSTSNLTKEWSAMVFDIEVAYKEDYDHVANIITETGKRLREQGESGKEMIDSLEIMGLDRFAESSVVIKARIKTRPGKQWATGREFRRMLKEAFDKEGIEIPFPQRQLWISEGTLSQSA